MEVILKRSKTRKPEGDHRGRCDRLRTQARLQVGLCSSLAMTAASSSSSSDPLNWESVLNGHPIFDPSSSSTDDKNSWKADDLSLELSISSLSKSKSSDTIQDGGVPNGRRRTMLIKDADLIVAVGKQVRMTSLTESQLSTAGERSFKVRGSAHC
jgi:hypothetical protein